MTVFLGACGEDECGGNVVAGAPEPPLNGIWEGYESPFGPDGTSAWWQFDMNYDATSGTFATDRPFHENYFSPDTLRGTFTGRVCPGQFEIELEFELRYPRSTNRDDPSFYPNPCVLSGKLTSHLYVDGIVGCDVDEYTTFWKAIYLVNERARRESSSSYTLKLQIDIARPAQ